MVKIISDSTSDLSQDLLDRYNITLVPLIVRLGDHRFPRTHGKRPAA